MSFLEPPNRLDPHDIVAILDAKSEDEIIAEIQAIKGEIAKVEEQIEKMREPLRKHMLALQVTHVFKGMPLAIWPEDQWRRTLVLLISSTDYSSDIWQHSSVVTRLTDSLWQVAFEGDNEDGLAMFEFKVHSSFSNALTEAEEYTALGTLPTGRIEDKDTMLLKSCQVQSVLDKKHRKIKLLSLKQTEPDQDGMHWVEMLVRKDGKDYVLSQTIFGQDEGFPGESWESYNFLPVPEER